MRPATSPRARILLVWAALLVLLAATTVLAYLPLGRWSLPVAMAIAVVKAGLILSIFMELLGASGLTLVFAAAGFFWLAILLGLPAADYRTRGIAQPGAHGTENREGTGEVLRR